MNDIYFNKDCFYKLFKIAKEEFIEHKEAAAILYGSISTIINCEKYESDKSNGSVVKWNDQEDLVKVLNEIGLKGIFHSHLFGSCNPSITDINVMKGLTNWAKMMNKPPLVSVIGGFWSDTFKVIVWEMDENYQCNARNIIWV